MSPIYEDLPNKVIIDSSDVNNVIIQDQENRIIVADTGAQGATGPQGIQGSSGVTSVTSPITNSGTSSAAVIGINQSLLSIAQTQVSGLVSDLTAKATIASPTFTGIPAAPTATAGTNTTQIATTAFVGTAVSNLVAAAPAALDTLNELATALGNNASFATTVTNSLAGKANLTGDNTFTGTQTLINSATGFAPLIVSAITGTTASPAQYYIGGTLLAQLTTGGTFHTACSITAGSSTGGVSARLAVIGATSTQVTTVIRGASGQSVDLLQVQDSAASNLLWITAAGNLNAPGQIRVGTSSGLAQMTVLSTNAATIGAVIRGATSQSANLLQLQASDGSVTASFTAPVNNVSRLNLGGTDLGATSGMTVHAAGGVGQIIRGAASQSADLQQWQTSDGSVRIAIDSTGRIVSQSSANLGGFPSGLAVLGVRTSSASTLVSAFRGAASQLEDLVEYQTDAGTVLGGRNANAQIFTGSTSPLTTSTGGATTATSGTGSVATVSTSSAHNLSNGDRVTISGITPTGYNGTYIVTVVSAFSFSYANATTGAQTVAGTVRIDAQSSSVSRSAATVGLLVRGATSQASNIFEVQNSSGNTLASVAANGSMLINGIGITTGDHRVGTVSYFSAALNVQARTATEVGQVIRGAASQTADLLQLQNSAGTSVNQVTPTGSQLWFGGLAAMLTANSGATLEMFRMTAQAGSPGANRGRLYFRDGTTGGTLKLVVRAGAAGAETTILDNIPQ